MKNQRYAMTVAWSLVGAILAPLALAADEPMFDLSADKVLYCVGYAHLDTQWRWDFSTTIDRYIRDTLEQNFERFEKFPGYVFNFTGSARYRMMKEYYPELYHKLRQYVADGRWIVSGSSVDEGDVNVPSAEAAIRQVLYGNEFFRREFGKESRDYMLPDCFGFPASMPSIWAHCGLLGFSTQKLTWGSAVGIPFKIGVWEGLDGRSVVAALDPGSYASAIKGRVDLNSEWVERINDNGRKYGVWADYHYYGVGDQGGAPLEEDVANYVASIDNPDSLIKVALVSSDQLYKDITPELRAKLPRYRGDLLLTEHSAGTLTSESYMKRWNRKNELLADAAERAAVFSTWLGATRYPLMKLNSSWERLLANQMHDILPGTSIPRAYTLSWNDEIVAANGFAAVLADSVGGIVRALDTQTSGQPIVVYNPLAVDREDLVTATIEVTEPAPPAMRIFDSQGRELPSQILRRSSDTVTVLFSARVPPVSFVVYEARPAEVPFADQNKLRVTPRSLENEHYRLTLNDAGDVSGLFDKNSGLELLAAPAGLVFTHERPRNWPAWNMDWADRRKPPIDRAAGPAQIRVIESGPVRAVLEVRRTARNSIITQQIHLARGEAGQRVEFKCDVDWQSTACALKASFPLTASNPQATYNWGMGTIARGNNEPTRYEVPSHEWFDLTDKAGAFGVSVLEDCKFGSDKPSDSELRLTLLYTPGVRHGYLDQHSQDWGRHEFTYALYGHPGDWREGRSEWQGRRLNQPLMAFQAPRHPGRLGRDVSFLKVNTQQIDVRALKKAENSDHLIVRLQELWGRPADNVEVAFLGNIVEAYEVDGQERRIGGVTRRDGKLIVNMTPFSPRSYAVRLGVPPTRLAPPDCTLLNLPFDSDVVSSDSDYSDGAFDRDGRSIPAEMLPGIFESDGITFGLGPKEPGKPNAVACDGQTIVLPSGRFERLYLLAAVGEDTSATFRFGDQAEPLGIQSWTGFVGQWDNRVWDREFDEVDYRCEGNVTGITPGYIKRDNIAWFCTHRHHPELGNEAYRFSYLFKYALDVPAGATSLTLPDNGDIKILGATVARNCNDDVVPAAPLYDDFSERRPVEFRHVYPPPLPPVFEGASASAAVNMDHRDNFDSLVMGPPVSTDYADQAAGHGVTFRYIDPDSEWPPHPYSGAVDGVLTRLNDGLAARNDDDPERCVWYNNAGRFTADLGRSLTLQRIITYSRHSSNRAPQYFSIWGSNAAPMPDPAFSAGQHEGWQLLAIVDTRELGQGGVHASSVTGRAAPLGPFRYLLWIVEDVGEGTFFTEIDIHVAE